MLPPNVIAILVQTCSTVGTGELLSYGCVIPREPTDRTTHTLNSQLLAGAPRFGVKGLKVLGFRRQGL